MAQKTPIETEDKTYYEVAEAIVKVYGYNDMPDEKLAELLGFDEEDVEMMKSYISAEEYKQCWIYLSEKIIREQLIHDATPESISEYIEDKLIQCYDADVDYKEVDAQNWFVQNADDKDDDISNTKRHFIITGHVYECLLNRALRGKSPTDKAKHAHQSIVRLRKLHKILQAYEHISIPHRMKELKKKLADLKLHASNIDEMVKYDIVKQAISGIIEETYGNEFDYDTDHNRKYTTTDGDEFAFIIDWSLFKTYIKRHVAFKIPETPILKEALEELVDESSAIKVLW